MREAARASILSLSDNANGDSMYSSGDARPSTGRSGTSDSHAPLMQNAQTKGSGLRYDLRDDTSEYDEGLMMRQPERGPGGGGHF